jgi:hypothetical protein
MHNVILILENGLEVAGYRGYGQYFTIDGKLIKERVIDWKENIKFPRWERLTSKSSKMTT